MKKRIKMRNFRQKISRMDISSEKISKYIEFLRTKNGVSQAEIAEKLGMSQQNYFTKEKLKNGISLDFINKVASFFGKTGLQLMNEAHKFEPSKKNEIEVFSEKLKKQIVTLIDELKPKL